MYIKKPCFQQVFINKTFWFLKMKIYNFCFYFGNSYTVQKHWGFPYVWARQTLVSEIILYSKSWNSCVPKVTLPFKGGILVWYRAFFLIFTLEKTEIIFNFGNKITNSANQTLGIAIILDIMEILQVSSATLMILFMKMTTFARSSGFDTHGVSDPLRVPR